MILDYISPMGGAIYVFPETYNPGATISCTEKYLVICNVYPTQPLLAWQGAGEGDTVRLPRGDVEGGEVGVVPATRGPV
jgi:hypothetical protein